MRSCASLQLRQASSEWRVGGGEGASVRGLANLCPRPRPRPCLSLGLGLGPITARTHFSVHRLFGPRAVSHNFATSSSGASEGETADTFANLGIASTLAESVANNLGILEPTAIQREAIKVLLGGHHAAIEGYTGSGKTLAYLLPILSDLMHGESETQTKEKVGVSSGKQRRPSNVRALVVVPSQELAMQICRVAQSLVEDKQLVQQCIGGANKKRQIAALKGNSPQIVVGTPGRLADLSNSGHLQTHFTEKLVLDEADKLLGETYSRDLHRLQTHVGKKAQGHQRILCSATLSASLGKQFVERGWISADYTHVCASPSPSITSTASQEEWQQGEMDLGSSPMKSGHVSIPELSPNLDHCWISAPKQRKADTVRRCINALQPKKVLVFHNFSNQLIQTAAKLTTGEITTGILDGKMNKDAKRRVIQQFTRGQIRALVASEAATRGLDFPGCDCVVNMDMPHDASHYVHRAGRTGRGLSHGIVITVPSGKEVHVINKYAKTLRVDIPEYKVTHGEVIEAQGHTHTQAQKNKQAEASSSSSSKEDDEEEQSQPEPIP